MFTLVTLEWESDQLDVMVDDNTSGLSLREIAGQFFQLDKDGITLLHEGVKILDDELVTLIVGYVSPVIQVSLDNYVDLNVIIDYNDEYSEGIYKSFIATIPITDQLPQLPGSIHSLELVDSSGTVYLDIDTPIDSLSLTDGDVVIIRINPPDDEPIEEQVEQLVVPIKIYLGQGRPIHTTIKIKAYYTLSQLATLIESKYDVNVIKILSRGEELDMNLTYDQLSHESRDELLMVIARPRHRNN